MHSPFSDSEAAPLQQPQTDNDASGSLQRVAVRPPRLSVWVTKWPHRGCVGASAWEARQ